MHQCEEAWEMVWRGIEGQPVDMGEYNCRYPCRYDSHTWATPKFHSRSRFLVLKLMDVLSYQGCQVTPLGRYPTTYQVPSGHILHAKNSGVTHTCTHGPSQFRGSGVGGRLYTDDVHCSIYVAMYVAHPSTISSVKH